MNEWQPIETAPKDGSDCIFFTPQYGGKQIISFLYPDGQPWLEMGHNHVAQQFTHWMPLPNPPKGE